MEELKEYKQIGISTDWELTNPLYEKLMQEIPNRYYKDILKTEDVFYLDKERKK